MWESRGFLARVFQAAVGIAVFPISIGSVIFHRPPFLSFGKQLRSRIPEDRRSRLRTWVLSRVSPSRPEARDFCRFSNVRLCKALLDRITDRGHIIETGTDTKPARVTVNLDRPTYASLVEVAKREDVSVSWLVRRAIEAFLARPLRQLRAIKGEDAALTGSSRLQFYGEFHSASEVPIPTMPIVDARAAHPTTHRVLAPDCLSSHLKLTRVGLAS